jgi:hypothetical protein
LWHSAADEYISKTFEFSSRLNASRKQKLNASQIPAEQVATVIHADALFERAVRTRPALHNSRPAGEIRKAVLLSWMATRGHLNHRQHRQAGLRW